MNYEELGVWAIALIPIFAIFVFVSLDDARLKRIRIRNKKKMEKFHQLIEDATKQK